MKMSDKQQFDDWWRTAEISDSPCETAWAAWQAALAAPVAPSAPVCRCSMTIRALGDGCQVCNPEMAAEIEADNLRDAAQPAAQDGCKPQDCRTPQDCVESGRCLDRSITSKS